MTYSEPFSASRSSRFLLLPVGHQGQDSKYGSVDGSFFRELLTIKLFGRQGRLPYWMLDARVVINLWRAGTPAPPEDIICGCLPAIANRSGEAGGESRSHRRLYFILSVCSPFTFAGVIL